MNSEGEFKKHTDSSPYHKKEEDYLTMLREALNEELMNYNVIEIRLSPSIHENLKRELGETDKTKPIHCIASLFGFPVIVDSSVGKDKMWILTRKEFR